MSGPAPRRAGLAPISDVLAQAVGWAALRRVDELIADIEAGVMPAFVRLELRALVGSIVDALSGRDLESVR